MRAITSYRPTRPHILIAAGLIAVLVVAGLGFWFVNSPAAGLHASLAVQNSEHVHVNEAVPIKFDHPVDLSHVTVTLDPDTPLDIAPSKQELVIKPQKGWDTTKRYHLSLSMVPTSDHKLTLKNWSTSFFTQPKVALTAVTVDGKAADPAKVSMGPKSKLALTFTLPMKPDTVSVLANGQPVPAGNLQWSPDNQSVTVNPPGMLPYAPLALQVAASSQSAYGDPMTDSSNIAVTEQPLLPVNSGSGIDANFSPVSPIEIVVENSGDARPQSGLQAADMVYEYISEYSISRMTAIYFNKPPGLVGPVRSCRMINPYLVFALDGYEECSGASVGTLHYLFGSPLVPGVINDFDTHNHFFRVDFKAAPHNLYTDGDRAASIRQQWALPPPSYYLDPPHADLDAGQPADAPSVPLHAVNWSYDGGRKEYLRFDHGAPFIDDLAHAQVHAKNVILLHVGFHDAGWVEDENGGAHSVWYDMLGSGPAEIYSDGKLIHGTWHMGVGGPQWYYDNHNAPYFTDEQGKLIELNTGLTWVHVIGNGQTG